MICNELCSPDMPTAFSDCKNQTRSAGIKSFGFFPCGENIDLTDVVSVTTAVSNGVVQMLPLGMGAKPVGSPELKQLASCLPPMPIGTWTHTATFETSFIDKTGNTDFAYYNTILKNPTGYRWFFVDCNGLIYFNNDYTTGSTTIQSGLNMIAVGGLDIVADATKEVQTYKLSFTLLYHEPIIVGRFIAGMDSALFDTTVVS
jgi:hypothetical protein